MVEGTTLSSWGSKALGLNAKILGGMFKLVSFFCEGATGGEVLSPLYFSKGMARALYGCGALSIESISRLALSGAALPWEATSSA